MVFEVWMEGESGAAALIEDPLPEDIQAMKDAGLHLEHTLEATEEEAAQREFIAWCQTMCDGEATVEHVDFDTLA